MNLFTKAFCIITDYLYEMQQKYLTEEIVDRRIIPVMSFLTFLLFIAAIIQIFLKLFNLI